MFTVGGIDRHYEPIYRPTVGWVLLEYPSSISRMSVKYWSNVCQVLVEYLVNKSAITWPILDWCPTNTRPILNWHSTNCQPIYWLGIAQHSFNTWISYQQTVGRYISRQCRPTPPTVNMIQKEYSKHCAVSHIGQATREKTRNLHHSYWADQSCWTSRLKA